MSDEEFVRCSECGNLNIKGTTKCVFCGAELPEIEGVTERVETFRCPSCNSELPITVSTCPICGWSKEAEAMMKEQEAETPRDLPSSDVPSPAVPSPSAPLPEVPSTEIPSSPPPPAVQEEAKEEPSMPAFFEKEEELVEEVEEEKPKIKTKSGVLFATIVGAIILAHYCINNLIGWVSIKITDPNLEIYPKMGSNIENYIQINALSFFLQIIATILVGFAFSKTIGWYKPNERKPLKTLILLIVVDILVNIIGAAGLVLILSPKDILFTYLVGGVFEYLIFCISTLFIPYIIGAYMFYHHINKALFPKAKLVEAK